MEEDEKPDLIIMDVPLLLERADVPLSDRVDILEHYELCRETIASFGNETKTRFIPLIKMELRLPLLAIKDLVLFFLY